MMKCKRHILAILLLLYACIATAYDFEKDGIYYKITSDVDKTVSVVSNPDDMSAYSGVITIPETVSYTYGTFSVTSIASSAFSYCSGLVGITIPNSVTVIEQEAFMNCGGLESITVPGSVTKIADRAFAYCSSLKSVLIRDGAITIGFAAFAGCKSLKDVVVECKTVPTIDADAFLNVKATLYVPYGTKTQYETADGWKTFPEIVEMDPEVAVTEVEIYVNEYGCGTFCSEYALDFSEVAGLKAYSAIGFNSSTQVVTLARVSATLGGTGIFIKGAPGKYTIPVIEECSDHTLNLLVGTLENTTVNSTAAEYSNFKFTITDDDDTPKFYPFEDGTEFSAGKAYLQIPTAWVIGKEQRSVNIRFDEGETTGIVNARGEDEDISTSFDLQGRKVDNPTNGLYIVNGKKFLVK